MTSSDEILENLRKLLNMEIVAETSLTLNSDEIYALRDLFAEIERLKGGLAAIVERYEREYKSGVAWDMVQIADNILKGGETCPQK